MKQLLLSIILIIPFYFTAQYTDYLGAGHSDAISVTASSQQTRIDWSESASAANTINGLGLDARTMETSRFLAQATLGVDLAYVTTVSDMTYEAWIDAQFALPAVLPEQTYGQLTQDFYDEAREMYFDNGGEGSYSGPNANHFQFAWWHRNTNNNDLLRQRITLALSEIFSFSHLFTSDDWGEGSGYFYDTLANNAFGNFENLLMDVTLQPMMGMYLTYYNNPKSDLDVNQFPDENYAREIMQLFTIGLDKLNLDGSYILDSGGNRIPTYDNDDVAEFAKVFTGLSCGEALYGITPNFGLEFSIADKGVPMAMYDAHHEPGPKYLLNGYTIPAGQPGMQDVQDAVSHLFNHPNVAPFISYRLIQRLVKSNPSSSYISAVASTFNNNGVGVRGDMKAVIKTILLHSEARTCMWINNPHQGKLREPMIRYYNLLNQVSLNNPSGFNWNTGDSYRRFTYQAPLTAYSIFNFFYPDFPPNGPIADAGLVGPEFQIHDSYTSVGYTNQLDSFIRENNSVYDNLEALGIDATTIDFSNLQYLAKDSETLLNHLDKTFTHGQLSNPSRLIIKEAIESFPTDASGLLNRSKIALWLVLVSPDYAVLK